MLRGTFLWCLARVEQLSSDAFDSVRQPLPCPWAREQTSAGVLTVCTQHFVLLLPLSPRLGSEGQTKPTMLSLVSQGCLLPTFQSLSMFVFHLASRIKYALSTLTTGSGCYPTSQKSEALSRAVACPRSQSCERPAFSPRTPASSCLSQHGR